MRSEKILVIQGFSSVMTDHAVSKKNVSVCRLSERPRVRIAPGATLVTIGMLALGVGFSIDALALYVAMIDITLEVSKMQNNNDFWLGGACGAKNHGKDQLVET